MTLRIVRLDDVPAGPRPHDQGMTSAGKDSGATAVEYALMVALIAALIFGSVALFGLAVVDLFAIPCPPFTDCGPA